LLDRLVAPATSKEGCKAASSSAAAVLLAAVLVCVGSGSSIASLSTENVPGVGASVVVGDGATGHAAAGRNVVVGLSSLVGILGDSVAVGRVDDHDHALLAMLGLRAVDVDGLIIRDGDHEHGSVAGLAVVVPVAASTIASTIASGSGGVAVGASIGVSGDGLEVGEDGVPLRLARVVGS